MKYPYECRNVIPWGTWYSFETMKELLLHVKDEMKNSPNGEVTIRFKTKEILDENKRSGG